MPQDSVCRTKSLSGASSSSFPPTCEGVGSSLEGPPSDVKEDGGLVQVVQPTHILHTHPLPIRPLLLPPTTTPLSPTLKTEY
jgi:hypothetical protein